MTSILLQPTYLITRAHRLYSNADTTLHKFVFLYLYTLVKILKKNAAMLQVNRDPIFDKTTWFYTVWFKDDLLFKCEVIF